MDNLEIFELPDFGRYFPIVNLQLVSEISKENNMEICQIFKDVNNSEYFLVIKELNYEFKHYFKISSLSSYNALLQYLNIQGLKFTALYDEVMYNYENISNISIEECFETYGSIILTVH
jgi:hypothetical protein